MDLLAIGNLGGYIKNLKLQSQWMLKQQQGAYNAKGKSLEDWLDGTGLQTEEDAFGDRGDDELRKIHQKLEAGGKLTQKEREYLQAHDPEAYRELVNQEREQKAYEQALRRCTTYDGLVEATRGSIYHDALERLRSADGALPDYGVTEALLSGVYYQKLQSIIRRKYDGDVRRILEKSVGSQVDMLNLMHILRMKRYFPQEDNYLPVLLPYHYKLKPQMIHAMCAAPNAEAVLELAQQTPYGRIFDQNSGEDLNYLYTATIYRTSRRQLMMGKPSIYSAVALMNLREIELKAVVSAVEAAKYQMALNPSILDMMDR